MLSAWARFFSGGDAVTDPKGYEIPGEMREFADRSVEQARKAFDGFVGAAHGAVAAMETSAETVQTGIRDVAGQTIAFAEANMAASFAFAQSLVRAADLAEVVRLQAEFVQSQMAALDAQARALGETVAKAVKPGEKRD